MLWSSRIAWDSHQRMVSRTRTRPAKTMSVRHLNTRWSASLRIISQNSSSTGMCSLFVFLLLFLSIWKGGLALAWSRTQTGLSKMKLKTKVRGLQNKSWKEWSNLYCEGEILCGSEGCLSELHDSSSTASVSQGRHMVIKITEAWSALEGHATENTSAWFGTQFTCLKSLGSCLFLKQQKQQKQQQIKINLGGSILEDVY